MEDTLTRRAFGAGAVAFIGAAVFGRLPKALAASSVATVPSWPDYRVRPIIGRQALRAWRDKTWPGFELLDSNEQALVVETLDEKGVVTIFVPVNKDTDLAMCDKSHPELRALVSDAYVDSRWLEMPEDGRSKEDCLMECKARYALPSEYSGGSDG